MLCFPLQPFAVAMLTRNRAQTGVAPTRHFRVDRLQKAPHDPTQTPDMTPP